MEFKIHNFEEDGDAKQVIIRPWEENPCLVEFIESSGMKTLCSISVEDACRIFKLLDEKRREETV